MDFTTTFLASFSKAPLLPSGTPAESLLGHVYDEKTDSVYHSLLSVSAYGAHYVSLPFSYYIRSLNSYLILYTKNGCGSLQTADSRFTLKEETLLFLDCRQSFSLSAAGNFWNFETYFCSGSLPAAFYQKQSGMLYDLSSAAEIRRYFQMLEGNNKNPLYRNPVLDLKCINNLFSDLTLIEEENGQPQKNVPPYLLYMKKCFDYSYANRYSLAAFEDELQISKYRLCREYTTVFGISPLQYLNQRRIDAAKDLLRTTNIPVHEVSTSVGFENTNHFINLFKRSAGMTPNVYRQKHRS